MENNCSVIQNVNKEKNTANKLMNIAVKSKGHLPNEQILDNNNVGTTPEKVKQKYTENRNLVIWGDSILK